MVAMADRSSTRIVFTGMHRHAVGSLTTQPLAASIVFAHLLLLLLLLLANQLPREEREERIAACC